MKIDFLGRSRLVICLLCLVLPLMSCQPLPSLLSGESAPENLPVMQVQRVLSGQTLDAVDTNDRTSHKLRLLGLDAPDSRQAPWGDRARQALESLTLDRAVRVDRRQRDRFGREWSYVWLNGKLANEQLIAAGWALAADDLADPDYARRLQRAQERARLLELGIWDPVEPLRQSPQNFRAQPRNFPDNKGN